MPTSTFEPPVETPSAEREPTPEPQLPSNPSPTRRERRQFHRIVERMPVSIKFSDLSEALGETANFCARGIFFHLQQRIAPGSQVELVFRLPKQVVVNEGVWMRCKAQVLRVDDALTAGRIGIAATLMEYEILET